MEVEAREPTGRKANLEYMVFQARLGYLVRPWNNKEAKPKENMFGGKQQPDPSGRCSGSVLPRMEWDRLWFDSECGLSCLSFKLFSKLSSILFLQKVIYVHRCIFYALYTNMTYMTGTYNRVSVYRIGCPGTRYVDQAGLKLRDPSASAFWVLGLKACAIVFDSNIF